jgi:hypothetical protein
MLGRQNRDDALAREPATIEDVVRESGAPPSSESRGVWLPTSTAMSAATSR